ncbi:MAG: alpha/beta hydrolase [Myxococcota bacterium]
MASSIHDSTDPPSAGIRAESERFFERPDGATICVQAWGDAGLPTLMILDGIGCSGWAFRRIIPGLRDAFRVVLMHYRGHGRSPTPPRPWRLGLDVFADDAVAVLDHEGADQAVLLGFSMGFQVSLEAYKRHRPRVAGLISLAGPASRAMAQFQGTDIFGHALPLLRAASRHASDLTLRLWKTLLPNQTLRKLGLQTQLNTARIDMEDIDFYLSQMARMSPELFLDLLQQAARHSSDDVLPRVRVPSLIVAGGQDRFVPLPTMREVAFSIPGAQWVVLPDASHALPAEYPEDVTEHVRRFTAATHGV